MSVEVLGGRLLADVQEEGLEDVSLTEAEQSKLYEFPLRPRPFIPVQRLLIKIYSC
jgi:hypothetical protein